jgi:hypothetical protein
MYSPSQLLSSLANEFRILKHLGAKVTSENKNAKLTEAQRTIEELEQYILSLAGQVAAVVRGGRDNEKFMEDIAFSQDFSFDQFDTKLDEAYDIIKNLIERLSDAQWAEEVSMRGQTKTRTEWLVGYVHVFLGAYKMQLFLQLKHAGLSTLGTMNVWGGIDG